MVVVADGVEVVNVATGEREGTLERGGHGVDLGFRRGEKEGSSCARGTSHRRPDDPVDVVAVLIARGPWPA